jgi:hypothetical protein
VEVAAVLEVVEAEVLLEAVEGALEAAVVVLGAEAEVLLEAVGAVEFLEAEVVRASRL